MSCRGDTFANLTLGEIMAGFSVAAGESAQGAKVRPHSNSPAVVI
jgi:hypothetical protein